MRTLLVRLTEEQFQVLQIGKPEISLEELESLLAARHALNSLSNLQALAKAHELDQLSTDELDAEIRATRHAKDGHS
jgi:hypothetical protein